MTDEARRVAMGLTKAQRKALLAMPEDTPFDPLKFARTIPTIAVLRSRRLIRTVADQVYPQRHGRRARWGPSIITARGLAVRTILQETDNGRN